MTLKLTRLVWHLIISNRWSNRYDSLCPPKGGLIQSRLLILYYLGFFIDIIGYCLMDKHFQLLIRTKPEEEFSDEEAWGRFEALNRGGRRLTAGHIPLLRSRQCDLIEFRLDLKL